MKIYNYENIQLNKNVTMYLCNYVPMATYTISV